MRFFQSYRAYKLHTNLFVGWLYEAAKECNIPEDLLLSSNSSNNTGSVNNIGKIVELISKVDFLSFSRTTQAKFNSALINCQEAIKLREKVSVFYRLTDKDSTVVTASNQKDENSNGEAINDDWTRHQYFINCLRKCHTVLSTAFAGSSFDDKITNSPSDIKNFNGFSVLQDDSSDDDSDTDGNEGDSQQPPRSEIQISGTSSSNVDSEFAKDLKLQLQCFVMDMDELLDQVCKSWGEVKAGNIPSFTASAVTSAAITSVQSLFAELQLSYPSIHTYTDLHAVIMEFIPHNFLFQCVKGLQIARAAARDCKFVRQFHAKGAAWLEAYSISMALYSFQNVCRQSSNGVSLLLRDGYFSEKFDEDDSESGIIPWILPDKSLVPTAAAAAEDNGTGAGEGANKKERFWVFLARELAVLREYLLAIKDQPIGGISSPFLNIMRAFLVEDSHHEISVPLVFASLCWVKSVMFLQGNCFIKRTVTLARDKLRNIYEHAIKSMQRKHISKANVDLHNCLVQLSVNLQSLLDNNCIAFIMYWRNNPYMANCLVLDYYFRYLDISCESLHITSRFRAFGHLYFAMRQRNLIEKIPYMEEILDIYDKMIFYPSRPVPNNFYSTYLLSSHNTALAVRDFLHPKVPPAGQQQQQQQQKRKKSTVDQKQQAKLKSGDIKVRNSMHSVELSDIVAFFNPYDSGNSANTKKNAVVKNAKSVSEVVSNVKEVMGFELLVSRVLSRDILFLNDELSELFERMVDILGARQSYNNYLSNEAELTLQRRVNCAAEISIMPQLLPFLDSLAAEEGSCCSHLDYNHPGAEQDTTIAALQADISGNNENLLRNERYGSLCV